MPWSIFTDPEVAQVRLREDETRQQRGDDVCVSRWPIEHVDRAQAEGVSRGFVKVVHTRRGAVLGATVVAARAGEMIHEYVLAMERGISLGDLASAIHVYPTYSFATQQVAAEYRVSSLFDGAAGTLLKSLSRWLR